MKPVLSEPQVDKVLIREIEGRARAIRRHIIEMVGKAGSGHPGGSLSSSDILATLYFGGFLRLKPEDPLWPERDRFILSKGHAAPALYAALAERGFFGKDVLLTLREFGSILQGHPDCRKTPGVEVSTGSLGQGLSMGVGMALAGKLDGKGYRVWVLLGDGECQEGQVWEAAMAASHYRLDNLTAIVDHNHLQIDGRIEEVMSPEPIAQKFSAFGWEVFEANGHDIQNLVNVFRKAATVRGKPSAVIADTVKGRGVSFMENQKEWHGKAPKGEELERALKELSGDHLR
ncbi:MAG TPA: transketolase [Firmicutes bacterium]|nr:transketolase [Candidatus Fermentithermobacillaceae bacterium]